MLTLLSIIYSCSEGSSLLRRTVWGGDEGGRIKVEESLDAEAEDMDQTPVSSNASNDGGAAELEQHRWGRTRGAHRRNAVLLEKANLFGDKRPQR